MKPSNFKVKPFASVLQKSEAETVACNIMVILARTGDTFRGLSWEEYKDERLKDGAFNDIEKKYFDKAMPYCLSAETAAAFSPIWAKIAAATSSPLPETETEAAEVYEYLEGPDGKFASESAPKGWETGAHPTPGNEREEGEGQTLLSQYEKYIEYCDEMIGQMVVPIHFVEWREFKKYPHL